MEIAKLIIGAILTIGLVITAAIAIKWLVEIETKKDSKRLELEERKVKALEIIADTYNQFHL